AAAGSSQRSLRLQTGQRGLSALRRSPGLVNSSSEPFYRCTECRYVTPLKAPLPSTRYVRCRCQALLVVRKLLRPYVTLYKHRYTHRLSKCFFSKYILSSGSQWKGDITLIAIKWSSCDSYISPMPFLMLFMCAFVAYIARRSRKHYQRHKSRLLQNLLELNRCTVLPMPQKTSGHHDPGAVSQPTCVSRRRSYLRLTGCRPPPPAVVPVARWICLNRGRQTVASFADSRTLGPDDSSTDCRYQH
uniref:LITAF domain-containing protein n=1 Tax=Macrostomum lignano TaxID=282301 RepID=A0A1I8F7H5_9PLAT